MSGEAQFETSSVPHYARGWSTAEKLRALLNIDRDRNAIVAYRDGKIHREHYTRLLGLCRSALLRYRYILAQYEQDLKIVTGPLRHLTEMREHMVASYEARTLELRGDKVDRAAIAARYNLCGGGVLRYEAIRALFEEFDARVKREGYLPAARQEEVDRVKGVLDGLPVLNKDRMTINQIALAQAAGIPHYRLWERPFADILSARQSEITTAVRACKIDPFVHRRVFPFSDLASLWPTPFLERIAIRFKQIAARLAEPEVPYYQLIDALAWIGASRIPHCQAVVAEANANGRVLSVDDWDDSLSAYRAHLISEIALQRATSRSVDRYLKALRVMLDALSSGRVVPSTPVPLPGVRSARRLGGHLRSVAEVGAAAAGTPRSAYVDFARDRFQEACVRSGADLGKGEGEAFIQGIAAELSIGGDLPTDAATAIRTVLERRLELLRSRAAAIVDAARADCERGNEMLSLARIDAATFESDYFGDKVGQYRRCSMVQELFPKPRFASEQDVKQGIANLLALINQRYAGIPPTHKGRGSGSGPCRQFFGKCYVAYGGLKAITSMLIPAADAVAATLTLYLIESGANLAVGRTLDRACVESSDLDGFFRISGRKARARGRPVIVDLPAGSPAVLAMEWLRIAGARLQTAAIKEDADRLFLMRMDGRVQLMTPDWYRAWFKSFAASTPGLESIELLPNMLRPSVLLHAALSDDGRLMAGLAIGQHGTTVTQGYQQKYPTRLLYDQNIKRFQNVFETLVVAGVKDAASKMNLTVEQFEARLGHVRATGLGTFCLDQRGRASKHGETCSTMDCWNDCPHLLIVAEVEAVAALQLWQRSLRDVQPEWERDRPERWDKVWLPWLCLGDVVQEKMVRGPMIKVWNAARRRAAEIAAQPGYLPPRPW